VKQFTLALIVSAALVGCSGSGDSVDGGGSGVVLSGPGDAGSGGTSITIPDNGPVATDNGSTGNGAQGSAGTGISPGTVASGGGNSSGDNSSGDNGSSVTDNSNPVVNTPPDTPAVIPPPAVVPTGPAVSALTATHRNGQTFVVWNEVNGADYHVYRHTAPITL